MDFRVAGDRLRELLSERVIIFKVAGGLLFFLLTLFIFAFIRFPVDQLAPAIEMAVARQNSGLRITISDVERDFPFGVSASGINVIGTQDGKSRAIIDINSITISPSVLSFLFGRSEFTGSASIQGGTADFRGDVRNNEAAFDLVFSKIEIGDLPFWNDFSWAKLTGALGGGADIKATEARLNNGNGSINIKLEGGFLTLSPLLASDLDPIAIDVAEIDAVISDGKVTISRFVIEGKDLSIDIGGDIDIAEQFGASRVKLRGSVTLNGELEDKLGPFLSMLRQNPKGGRSFRVGGTIDNPSFNKSGRAGKSQRPDRSFRPDKQGRKDKVKRRGRGDRYDKINKRDRVDREDRMNRPDRKNRAGREDRMNRPDRKNRAGRKNRSERNSRGSFKDKDERP